MGELHTKIQKVLINFLPAVHDKHEGPSTCLDMLWH